MTTDIERKLTVSSEGKLEVNIAGKLTVTIEGTLTVNIEGVGLLRFANLVSNLALDYRVLHAPLDLKNRELILFLILKMNRSIAAFCKKHITFGDDFDLMFISSCSS